MIDTSERITPVLRYPNDGRSERKRDDGGRFTTEKERRVEGLRRESEAMGADVEAPKLGMRSPIKPRRPMPKETPETLSKGSY